MGDLEKYPANTPEMKNIFDEEWEEVIPIFSFSFSYCLSLWLQITVGEKWMRDKRSPKDVCGEASEALALSPGGPQSVQSPTWSNIPQLA